MFIYKMYWMLYNIVRLRTSKKWDNRFSEINRSVNVGIASGNGVSNMQRIMTYLNLPMSVARWCSYNEILNNIAQNSIEIAEESIDKTSRNKFSKCRSDDDEDNKIYPKNYKSYVKNWWDIAKAILL